MLLLGLLLLVLDQVHIGLLLDLSEPPLLVDHHVDRVARLGQVDLRDFAHRLLDRLRPTQMERAPSHHFVFLLLGDADRGQLLLVAVLVNQVADRIRVLMLVRSIVLDLMLDKANHLANIVFIGCEARVKAVRLQDKVFDGACVFAFGDDARKLPEFWRLLPEATEGRGLLVVGEQARVASLC